jgi:hypothetical protein
LNLNFSLNVYSFSPGCSGNPFSIPTELKNSVGIEKDWNGKRELPLLKCASHSLLKKNKYIVTINKIKVLTEV